MEEIIYLTVFNVSGISFREKEVRQLLKSMSEYNSPYYGLTGKNLKDEIKENGIVYKYDGWVASSLSFESEPNNEFDSHAVKIFVDDIHIGYIPKKEAKRVFDLIENNNQYKFIAQLSIVGGDSKIIDDDTNRIETIENDNIGFEIVLKVVKESDKLVTSEQVTEQKDNVETFVDIIDDMTYSSYNYDCEYEYQNNKTVPLFIRFYTIAICTIGGLILGFFVPFFWLFFIAGIPLLIIRAIWEVKHKLEHLHN